MIAAIQEPVRVNRRSMGKYLPSPEEIRLACLEIQKEWSEKERRRRAGRVQHLVRIFEFSAPYAMS